MTVYTVDVWVCTFNPFPFILGFKLLELFHHFLGYSFFYCFHFNLNPLLFLSLVLLSLKRAIDLRLQNACNNLSLEWLAFLFPFLYDYSSCDAVSFHVPKGPMALVYLHGLLGWYPAVKSRGFSDELVLKLHVRSRGLSQGMKGHLDMSHEISHLNKTVTI